MSILIFYGSYRSDRMGIRLAEFVVERFRRRGEDVELIDAKAIDLPMLDRMYKEYPRGKAPEPLERLAGQIRDADGFVFGQIAAVRTAAAPSRIIIRRSRRQRHGSFVRSAKVQASARPRRCCN